MTIRLSKVSNFSGAKGGTKGGTKGILSIKTPNQYISKNYKNALKK